MSGMLEPRAYVAFGKGWSKWWRTVALVAALGISGNVCEAQAPPGEIAAAPAPQLDALILARKYVQEYFDKYSEPCLQGIRNADRIEWQRPLHLPRKLGLRLSV